MKTAAKQFIIDNYGETWLHTEWSAGDVMDAMDDFHELRMEEIKAELSTEESTEYEKLKNLANASPLALKIAQEEESTPKLTDEADVKETACCLCEHYIDNMRKNGTQSKCSYFNEVCCAVNKEGHCDCFMPKSLPASDTQKDEIIAKYEELFELAIKTIRAWHSMERVSDEHEIMMWGIYNRNSPEMKRLNQINEEILAKLRNKETV